MNRTGKNRSRSLWRYGWTLLLVSSCICLWGVKRACAQQHAGTLSTQEKTAVEDPAASFRKEAMVHEAEAPEAMTVASNKPQQMETHGIVSMVQSIFHNLSKNPQELPRKSERLTQALGTQPKPDREPKILSPVSSESQPSPATQGKNWRSSLIADWKDNPAWQTAEFGRLRLLSHLLQADQSYQQMKDQLERRLADLQAQADRLEKDLTQAQSAKTELGDRIKRLEQAQTAARRNFPQLMQTLQAKEEELRRLASALEKTQAQLAQSSKAKGDLEKQQGDLAAAQTAAENQAAELNQKLQSREKELRDLQSARESDQKSILRLQQQAEESTKLQTQREIALAQTQAALAKTQANLTIVESELRGNRQSVLWATQELTTASAQLQEKNKEIQRLMSVLGDLNRQLAELRTERDRLVENLSQARRFGEQAQTASREAQQANAGLQDRVHQLESAQSVLQIEAAQHRQTLQAKEEELRRLNASLSEAVRTGAQLKSDYQLSQQEVNSLREQLKQERERLAKLTSGLQSLQQVMGASQPTSPQELPKETVTSTGTPPPAVSSEPAVPQEQQQLEENSKRQFVSPSTSKVVVQRLSENRDFLVLSVFAVPGVKEGMRLLLSSEEQPVVEVELGNIDSSGMTMGYVTLTHKDLSIIHEGQVLSAKILVKASAAVDE